MKKRIVLLGTLATLFLAGCGNSERTPGEEYYDPEYRAQRTAERAEAGNSRDHDPTERTDFGAAAPPAELGAGQATNQPAAQAGGGTAAAPATTGTATTGTATAERTAPATPTQAGTAARTGTPAQTGSPAQTGTAAQAPAAQQPAPAQATAFTPAEIQKGKTLIGQSDCLACHQIEQRVVGPSYVEVADKYPPTSANVNALATKIIKGGAGAWGQVPMSPHPNVPEADARDMVKYILSLKK